MQLTIQRIEMILGARAGDIIWYYTTDDKKRGVSINLEEIDICKYKEILMAAMRAVLEILGYGSTFPTTV